MSKTTSDVFGVATEVRPDSYVDRGRLDKAISKFLARDVHISLRGASKSGKSWLRQKAVPNAIVVQCRLGKTAEDLYKEALAILGINLIISETRGGTFSGTVESTAEIGQTLIGKVTAKLGLGYTRSAQTQSTPLRQDISNLRFVADLVIESGRRLVIEDVHYLSLAERKKLSFDLKTFWDYGLYVIIVGIWRQQSLIDLNSDLSSRIREISIQWSDSDLRNILDAGSKALNVEFAQVLRDRIVKFSYGNAGLLQTLALGVLDEADVHARGKDVVDIHGTDLLDSAAMELAESLNTLYQSFAKRTSTGMRSRTNSTGIYAHAMAVILEQDDSSLMRGLALKDLFKIAHEREPRILLANLRTILRKLDQLQIDEDGRGLVITFDEGREEVAVVDLQLLLYRHFSTVAWPWEELLAEVEDRSDVYAADPS